MTELLNLKATDKVLEIGTGSGYQTAILSQIVKKVYSVEIVEPLAQKAKKILTELDCSNVTVIVGDGNKGYTEEAPFDAIIATAAPPQIPPALIDQLAEGGTLIIPVGYRYQPQYLTKIEKTKDGIKETKMMPVSFVPFTGNVQ